MTRSDDVRVDRNAEYPESFVQVVIPERLVPLRRAALQEFAAPDVVYEDIDMTVISPDPRAASSSTCPASDGRRLWQLPCLRGS